MLAVVELPNVFSDVCTSNTSVALNVHVVAEGHDNGLNLGRKFTGGREDKGCKKKSA